MIFQLETNSVIRVISLPISFEFNKFLDCNQNTYFSQFAMLFVHLYKKNKVLPRKYLSFIQLNNFTVTERMAIHSVGKSVFEIGT